MPEFVVILKSKYKVVIEVARFEIDGNGVWFYDLNDNVNAYFQLDCIEGFAKRYSKGEVNELDKMQG